MKTHRPGICSACDARPVKPGLSPRLKQPYKTCAECQRRTRERAEKLIAEGKCTHCAGDRGEDGSLTRCRRCNTHQGRTWRARRGIPIDGVLIVAKRKLLHGEKTVKVSLHLTREERDHLRALAKGEGLSICELVRRMTLLWEEAESEAA